MKTSLVSFAVVVGTLLPSFSFAASRSRIPNYQTVEEGLTRGGRPTQKDLEWLRSQGFKTIINLEDSDSAVAQEKKWADKLGFDTVNAPMDVFETPSETKTAQLLAILNDPLVNGPIYIHCKEGRDRTGLLVGLHRVLNRGWDAKTSYKEMLKYGFRSWLSALDDYYREKSGLGEN